MQSEGHEKHPLSLMPQGSKRLMFKRERLPGDFVAILLSFLLFGLLLDSLHRGMKSAPDTCPGFDTRWQSAANIV